SYGALDGIAKVTEDGAGAADGVYGEEGPVETRACNNICDQDDTSGIEGDKLWEHSCGALGRVAKVTEDGTGAADGVHGEEGAAAARSCNNIYDHDDPGAIPTQRSSELSCGALDRVAKVTEDGAGAADGVHGEEGPVGARARSTIYDQDGTSGIEGDTKW